MNDGQGSSGLADIGVRVEAAEPQDVDYLTLNVVPLLHEVRHALSRLLADGESTVIDLGSIPLAPGELDRIDGALGAGEVRVLLDSMGPSQIYETMFRGVWRITHFNAANEVVGRYVEITRIPGILLAQDADMRESLDLLTRKLSGESD